MWEMAVDTLCLNAPGLVATVHIIPVGSRLHGAQLRYLLLETPVYYLPAPPMHNSVQTQRGVLET